MCYLVAKNYKKPGSLVVKAEYGKKLAALVEYLSRSKEGTDIQILTISSKEAYGEYRPFTEVESESDFITKVLAM